MRDDLNIFRRIWRRLLIKWRLRQMKKDDPFIYEREE